MDYEDSVGNVVLAFYEAYYSGNRLALYSYLCTSFQREVPLNYFLIHSDYDIDLGTLIDITKIEVRKENNIAFIEAVIKIHNNKKDILITLESDFGGWKIEGKSIFKRDF